MTTGRDTPHGDGDALSWHGDDDPTLDTGVETAREPAAPARAPRARRGREAGPSAPVARAVDVPGDEHVEQAALGSVALVVLGMIAAAYLLFAVGWLIAALRLQAVSGLPVAGATLAAIGIAAALAPIVWLAAVLVITRRSRTWVRFAWLVAGVILLVPWPFIGTGAFA